MLQREEVQEEEVEFIASRYWRGKHNSLSLFALAQTNQRETQTEQERDRQTEGERVKLVCRI